MTVMRCLVNTTDQRQVLRSSHSSCQALFVNILREKAYEAGQVTGQKDRQKGENEQLNHVRTEKLIY
jgi:midasin (ATPase involved in ribosome maturation)